MTTTIIHGKHHVDTTTTENNKKYKPDPQTCNLIQLEMLLIGAKYYIDITKLTHAVNNKQQLISVTIHQQWQQLCDLLKQNDSTLIQGKINIVCNVLSSLQPDKIPLSVLRNNCTFENAAAMLTIISSGASRLCEVTDRIGEVLNMLSEWINTIGLVLPNRQVSANDVIVTRGSVQSLLAPRTNNDSKKHTKNKKQSKTTAIVIDQELLFECDQEGCDKKFATKKNLTLHRKRHREKGEYQCVIDKCGKILTTKDGIKHHYKTHLKNGEIDTIPQIVRTDTINNATDNTDANDNNSISSDGESDSDDVSVQSIHNTNTDNNDNTNITSDTDSDVVTSIDAQTDMAVEQTIPVPYDSNRNVYSQIDDNSGGFERAADVLTDCATIEQQPYDTNVNNNKLRTRVPLPKLPPIDECLPEFIQSNAHTAAAGTNDTLQSTVEPTINHTTLATIEHHNTENNSMIESVNTSVQIKQEQYDIPDTKGVIIINISTPSNDKTFAAGVFITYRCRTLYRAVAKHADCSVDEFVLRYNEHTITTETYISELGIAPGSTVTFDFAYCDTANDAKL